MKALQAQVNPHFLFNSLNVIVSLTRTEPDRARSLLIALSKFFRQNLNATRKTWITLEEELKHVKAYLLIEETRFVDRLHVYYDVDEAALTARIAPLTLQPLVENCMKHGIKDQDGEAIIRISVKAEEDGVRVSIEDNGTGIDPERLETLGTDYVDSHNGTGFGIYNVNRRLEHMHGKGSTLSIKSEHGAGTEITFLLPVERQEITR
ncbi:histidine kinase [Halobacillus sp. BAB-2008]|uniref:sensor histidine kinase n=1 Tax=Halobacillus sp. BAB-2008 TaxID=1246484 RepID=UPI00030D0301